MIFVVADTSPINYLVLIGAEEILPRLFERIFIPPAVYRELTAKDAPQAVRSWVESTRLWLFMQSPRHVEDLGLDPGETEAIALAEELKASAVLLDERRARIAAEHRGGCD